MLLRPVRPRTVLLLDFLAPSLLSSPSRSVSSASIRKAKTIPVQKTETIPLQNIGSDIPIVVQKLQNQILLGQKGSRISDDKAATFNVSLTKLRLALQDDDALAVKELMTLLKQKDLLRLLTPTDLRQTSDFMLSRLLPKDGAEGGSRLERILEDIAIKAAAVRATDALNACMAFYLKKNDASAVIGLYQRFIKAEEEREVWNEDGLLAAKKGKPTDKRSSPTPLHPGRVSILLAATTAHAMRNSFKDALDTYLATPVRFHHFTTLEFLKNLEYDPLLRDKMAVYVKRLDTARLVARPPSFSKHVTNLSATGSADGLETFYNDIIEGLIGPNPFLAADPSLVTKDKSVALTEVGWTSFLVAFLKSEQRELASKVWDDRSRWGLRPSVSMWTALLDAYDSVRAADDAVAAWGMMLDQGVKPDGLTYRAMISVLFNARQQDRAMDLFREFRKKCLKNSSLEQIRSVYNTVLHGLLWDTRIDEANTLMQEMHTTGPAPDIVSYNTFMAYFGRRTDFKGLSGVLSKMASVNIVGDVFTFSTILSALLKVGKKDAPEVVFNIMQKHNIEPNTATYTAIIDTLMKEQTEIHLRSAFTLLDIMERTPQMKPNQVTYTAILGGLYRGSWLKPEKMEASRLEVMQRMKNRGVMFGLPAYHILLKAFLGYSHDDGLRNALASYREMRERNLPFANTTWYLLFAGLLHRGEWEIAEELVKDMYASGHKPGGTVLMLVRRIRSRTQN